MISNATDILSDDDYRVSSRQQKHRIHYSRIKSAAIAASYRLMHVSTDNVLVRMTANAAVNGMRPQYVKAAQEHKQQVERDIVEDEMYNHKDGIDPIVDLCLIKEPRRNKDVLSLLPFYLSIFPSLLLSVHGSSTTNELSPFRSLCEFAIYSVFPFIFEPICCSKINIDSFSNRISNHLRATNLCYYQH